MAVGASSTNEHSGQQQQYSFLCDLLFKKGRGRHPIAVPAGSVFQVGGWDSPFMIPRDFGTLVGAFVLL